MNKNFVKFSIYLLCAVILAGCVYFFFLEPHLRPCGKLDGYLGSSGCIGFIEVVDDTGHMLLFTPDGTVLVTLSVHNKIDIWRVDNNQLIYNLATGQTETVNAILLASNGLTLAIVFYRRIELWQVKDGTLLEVLPVEDSFSALTSDLSTAATRSAVGPMNMWQFDGQTFVPVHTLMGHTDQVWRVGFSLDGKFLASGSVDETVRLWRVDDGALLHTLSGQMGVIQSLAFSPDGKLIAAGGNKIIKVWRVDDGSLVHTLAGHRGDIVGLGHIRSLAFSADGKLLASAGKDGTVRLWRVSDGALLHTIKHGDEVWSVAFSPDGNLLASAEARGPIRFFDIQQLELEQSQ